MRAVHFIPPKVRRLALLATQASQAPILILGEEGSGKEAIAKWVHRHGPRAPHAFVHYERDELFSAQLLRASGGSLFFPEIAGLELGKQQLLYQFLIDGSIPHPEDARLKVHVNVRICASTCYQLDNRAQGGLFNSDLLKKLNVFRIEMPPLRERQEEFAQIAQGLLREIVAEEGMDPTSLSREALSSLLEHRWPGNIRELRNVLRYAALQQRSSIIGEADLPDLEFHPVDFTARREEFEKTYLNDLLDAAEGDLERASQESGLPAAILEKKIKKYQMDDYSRA